jgi:hypothetical protein
LPLPLPLHLSLSLSLSLPLPFFAFVLVFVFVFAFAFALSRLASFLFFVWLVLPQQRLGYSRSPVKNQNVKPKHKHARIEVEGYCHHLLSKVKGEG